MGTLSQQITSQVTSLQGLLNHLEGIRTYLELVATKRLPINHTILYLLQDIFNLLPNLNVDEFSKAFIVKTNDQLLVVYLASLIRAVIALHELIQNKVANREAERQEATTTSSSAKKKDKEAKEQVCCVHGISPTVFWGLCSKVEFQMGVVGGYVWVWSVGVGGCKSVGM